MEAPNISVIIVHEKTSEQIAEIPIDESVVKSIAALFNKYQEEIVVIYEGSVIELGHTIADCGIIPYSRLTVEHINKKPTIISHYKCTPTPEEQADQRARNAQNDLIAPLKRCNACTGNKHTSGLISLYFLGILYNIFVEQETSYHEPFKNSFTYSTEIENISSEYPLDTEGIQSDPNLITFLLLQNGISKSIEEHEEKYVMTPNM